MRTWTVVAKSASKKQKIRHFVCKVLDFKVIKFDIFLSGTDYALLKMFVVRTLSYQVKPDNV